MRGSALAILSSCLLCACLSTPDRQSAGSDPAADPAPSDLGPEDVLEVVDHGDPGDVPDDGVPDAAPDPVEDAAGDVPQVDGPDANEADLPDGTDPATDADAADVADVMDGTDAPDGTGAPDGADAPDAPSPFACAGDGGVWCSCTTDADCKVGACMETLSGGLCSPACEDASECPAGWVCLAPPVPGAPTRCAAPYRLCRPCKADAECKDPAWPAEGRCLERGPEGSFCGTPCDGTLSCPAGFSCGDDGQCLPADGAACPCTFVFKYGGFLTTCRVANEHGECLGERTCASGCSARAPQPEQCNGTDDDCDGDTDEGIASVPCVLSSPHGKCLGTTTCDGGAVACSAPYPVPEACNGADDDCDGDVDEGWGDLDQDSLADCVDPDMDGDGVANEADTCPAVADPLQADSDGDEFGDACDPDADGDGALDAADVCPGLADPDQEDIDGDHVGDACDPDMDGDGVANDTDLCPRTPDPDPSDLDKDAVGDACDPDADGDGKANGADNCPLVANADQADLDKDKIGDACDPDVDGDGNPNEKDNCPWTFNPDQADANLNSIGDACEDDWDGDKFPNGMDNCPWDWNPTQQDQDGDGDGDACDCDVDDDGWGNANPDCPVAMDNCPVHANVDQTDLDADGTGDACDPDLDGDGDPNGTDCGPSDPAVGHRQAETCNGVDDDCDGVTDEEDAEGCAPRFKDADHDGFGVPGPRCLCSAVGDWDAEQAGDCDDTAPGVNPETAESCNARDDDCDGWTDEAGASGCAPHYPDADGDGWGVDKDPRCLCAPELKFPTSRAGDCNDADPATNPGADERCGGGDEDCDGTIDEGGAVGCRDWYPDADGDKHGAVGQGKCRCGPSATYAVSIGGDCDDGNDAIHPGASAICGKDADCDGDPKEKTEECDDGNGAPWDGCNGCVVGSFQVNQVTAGDQRSPDVAGTADGGWVIAWEGPVAGQGQVRGRHFPAAGKDGGPEFRIDDGPGGTRGVRVAALPPPKGGFVAVYEDKGAIRLRLFDPAAIPQGSSGYVAPRMDYLGREYQVVGTPAGFLIAYSGEAYSIVLSAFDASGNKVGTDAPQGVGVNPDVAFSIAGMPLVVWLSRIDQTTWVHGNLIAEAPYSANWYDSFQRLAGAFCTGGFVAAWDVTADSAYYAVALQRFDSAGKKAGAQELLGAGLGAAFASLPSGKVAAAWFEPLPEPKHRVRVIPGATGPQGPGFLASAYQMKAGLTDLSGRFGPVAVAALADGRFVVAFETGGHQDGNGTGVFAQRFDETGTYLYR